MGRLLVRGVSRLVAGVLATLLYYGFILAMGGMTTRIPTAAVTEFAITALWLLPLALVLCSGADDIASAGRQGWSFWALTCAGMVLVYHYEFHTTSGRLTRLVAPAAAFLLSVIPHVVPRLRFVYSISSYVAGILGIIMLYWVGKTILSANTSFSTTGTGIFFVVFGLACCLAAALSVQLRHFRN